MPGFVDTTVLIDVAEGSEPIRSNTRSLAAASGPLELPDYALRELLAGKVQILCDAHNRVSASGNAAAAIESVLALAGFKARTVTSTAAAIASTLKKALDKPGMSANDATREVLQDLKIQAARLWRNARGVPFFTSVQQLSCIAMGPIHIDNATDTLRGPNNSFSCAKEQRCAAAMYMHERAGDLPKLIAALHPDNLGPVLAAKRENQTRKTALKDLLKRGPKDFRKSYCRALGDAYFALMAPLGSVVLTTNLQDHQPLCAALKKTAKIP